jgi:vancomycin aglycone glucosyltransferase
VRFVLAAYGSRGDVEPCVAVGRELLRRSHDVRMAVPPDRFGLIESAGLDAIAYGPHTRQQINAATGLISQVGNPISALPKVVESVTAMWVEKTVTLSPLAQGADLLIAGMNEQDLVANIADCHDIPFAALHFFPAQVLELGPLQSHVTTVARNVQRRELGLPEVSEAPSGSLEIQAYDEFLLPGLAIQWGEDAARRPFVGALTLEMPSSADDEVRAWIADGAPPIYFGFGSTPVASFAHTVAMIAAACADLGERAMICAGANAFAHVSQDDHVKIVDSVDHATVLPACRAIVHHGGAGTTAAGLRAGLPTLILWLWLDQPVWAAAIEQLKVGTGQPFTAATRQSLADGLGSILTPPCVARAREVAALMATSAQSIAHAADLLEDAARAARI